VVWVPGRKFHGDWVEEIRPTDNSAFTWTFVEALLYIYCGATFDVGAADTALKCDQPAERRVRSLTKIAFYATLGLSVRQLAPSASCVVRIHDAGFTAVGPIKLKFHEISFLVASSRQPCDDATSDVARVSGDFSLPRAYLICRPAVCCPFVRVSCRSPKATSQTRTTCCGQVASILVASSSDTSDTPNFLVTCYRHLCEDVTRLLRGSCFRGISASPRYGPTRFSSGHLPFK